MSHLNREFVSQPISTTTKQFIWNNSYHPNDTIRLEELAHLKILHYNFANEISCGELIVNKSIAEQTLHVFFDLFLEKYPIEKVRLIDYYNADDECSMADNNSSAFNYRFIDSTTTLSNHSKGLAIDINPLYNPYIKMVNGILRILPKEGCKYANRCLENPYYIRKNDICYQIFKTYGFTWGGDWEHSKDYQHFEYAF